MKMVVTLRNGVQIAMGVEDFNTRSDPIGGHLKGIDWTLDDDPGGNSIAWISIPDVVAVHAERGKEEGT